MSKNPPALLVAAKKGVMGRSEPERRGGRRPSRATLTAAAQEVATAVLEGPGAGAYLEDENMGGRDRPLFNWGWRPRATSPNDPFLNRTLDARAQSRELIARDPIAAGAINVNKAHVVGTGLTMQATVHADALGMTPEAAREWNTKTSRLFAQWASSPECDVTGMLDFYDQQMLVLVSVLSSGDVFTLLTEGEIGQLALQLIEADRVCNERNEQDQEGKRVQGINLNAAGRPIGIEVCSGYPEGTTVGNLTWRKIPMRGPTSGRRNVLHVVEIIRPGQVRGLPYLSVVVEPLKNLNRYSHAELHAAVTAAALTVFTQMDPDAFELFTDASKEAIIERGMEWDGRVRSGTAINLLPGEKVEVPENKRPNANYDPFFLAMVRQIGIGLEIPYEVLIKHFDSSYSASRAALLDAWRTFRRRRDWLAKKFCQPVYEEWLADQVASGRIAAPGFFASPDVRWAYSQAAWIGDGPGAIDPGKEADAAEKRMALGISTLQDESILHDGRPWELKHAQRVVEVTTRRKAGLEQDPMLLAQAKAPKPTQAPAREEEDEAD